MEELAKYLQRAQAAVLGVRKDVALLRAHVEEDAEGWDAGGIVKDATAGLGTSVSPRNPYYVELHTTVQERQEAASQLLERCTHFFYEQFSVLEERAARLDNVRVKEKELQSAKKSMQRYFEAHAKELEEERDNHSGALQIEWARRHHLEDGILHVEVKRRQQCLAHGILRLWLKKAMMRNLAREYRQRRDATTDIHQTATCNALAHQQQIKIMQKALCTWRLRVQQRRTRLLEVNATEAEKRAQFFRKELTTTQKTLHDYLSSDTSKHSPTIIAVSPEKEATQYEEELGRLRVSLHDMTMEFSERTRTYVRQQEGLEQLFMRKEEALRDTVCGLQATLTAERQVHSGFIASCEYFFEHVNSHWLAQLQEMAETVRRKEEFTHHTILGLSGRLYQRYNTLLQEATKLRCDVDTLAPLSERCVHLENELAESEKLLQRKKTSSQFSERRCKAAGVVASLLTDRAAFADSAVLRSRYFIRWLERSCVSSSERYQGSIGTLSDKLQTQRRQMLLQQQEQSSRHQEEVGHLRDELEQQRRLNTRLESELATAARTQRERDSAYYESEVRNGELSAAMLREKIERRGMEDKLWSRRASGLVLQEEQERLRVEAEEGLWWTALLMRESKALKVWAASLHCEVAHLADVCEGWQQHSHQLEAAHGTARRSAAGRTASALERGVLHAQTLAVWTSWRMWAQQRGALNASEAQAAQSRMEMIKGHKVELTRLHAIHDKAVHTLYREHAEEKAQLQAIHQERCVTLRRVQAEEMQRLSERHAQQLTITETTYAADISERDEQANAMQMQLRHVGSQVVEYCAQATYSRWRLWTTVRQAQRAARHRRGLVTQMSEWHTARVVMAEASAASKIALCVSALTEVVQRGAVDVQRWVQCIEQEKELCHSQTLKLQAAKETAEEEATQLRGDLQHVRVLYDAETHYTERLLRTAATERRVRHSSFTFTARMSEWKDLALYHFAGHYKVALDIFTEAAGRLMADLLAAQRRGLNSDVSRVGNGEAVSPKDPDGTVALFLAEADAAGLRLSDGDGVTEVSSSAPASCRYDTKKVGVCSGYGDNRITLTGAIAVTQSLVTVVPESLHSRLRSMENYVMTPGDTCDSEHEAGGASSGRCMHLLSEPFFEELTLSYICSTVVACQQVAEADVPRAVCYLLELVRLVAVRATEAQRRQCANEIAAIEARRVRAEETLGILHASRGGLLTEQCIVAEGTSSSQTPLKRVDTWQERLRALTDRYARVLDALHTDITRHQENCSNVHSILTEMDVFWRSSLKRFEENVSAMEQMTQQLLAKAQADEALQHGSSNLDTSLPAIVAAKVENIGKCTPEPKSFAAPDPVSLSPLYAGDATNSVSAHHSEPDATSGARASLFAAASLPEMRSLRDRVHVLERLLVDAKVQLAEAKSLAEVASSGAPLSQASAQAQLWASQDVEDFSELALTKEQLLLLYAASESTTRRLMMAMREHEAKVHETRSAVAQQIRTACVAVEETLQARHRADVELYQAKVRTLTENLTEAIKEKSMAQADQEKLEQQLKTETAKWADKYMRDTQLIRQSCLSEVNELTDHQRLLEEELQRCRDATQSAVQKAVDRQTELLRLEHAEQLSRAERDVSRLTTEKMLLNGRLQALEMDCEQRVHQERAAVKRLQQQLAAEVGVGEEVSSLSTCVGWEVHLLGTMDLYACYAAEKSAWFAASATFLLDAERDQWETEVVQLRERVARLVAASPVLSATPVHNHGPDHESKNAQTDGRITSPCERVEENSSQALTLSPSPRRNNQGVSAGDRGASGAAWNSTTPKTPSRFLTDPGSGQTSRENKGAQVVYNFSTSPTRCRSLSVDSLDLSQSVLRFSNMLSDQRIRNAARLERASVLIAEVDDLLVHGAQFTDSSISRNDCWSTSALEEEGGKV